jgi:hypothetical protein
MDTEKEMIKIEGCKILLDVFQFVGISRHNGIPNNEDVLKLNSN